MSVKIDVESDYIELDWDTLAFNNNDGFHIGLGLILYSLVWVIMILIPINLSSSLAAAIGIISIGLIAGIICLIKSLVRAQLILRIPKEVKIKDAKIDQK